MTLALTHNHPVDCPQDKLQAFSLTIGSCRSRSDREMKLARHFEEKFRQLAQLQRLCPDVTKDVVPTFENVSAKTAFDKLRSELEEAIDSDEFRRRFDRYLKKIEKEKDAARIIEQQAIADTQALWWSRVPYAVVRQNGVGHGGFHTGTLGIERHRLHWVYDCGSWKRREALTARIQEFSQRISSCDRIDLLFISHFDTDHVSGLRQLITAVGRRVDTVVVPYLNSDDMFVVLAEALTKGRCPQDFVEQVIDPVAWFHRIGARRVIRLRPPPPPDGSELPVDPDPGGVPMLPIKDKDGDGVERLDSVFVQPNGTPLSDGKSVVAQAGTRAGVWTDQGWADWWFVPFVQPVSIQTRRRLRRVARKVIPGSAGGRAFRNRLVKLLQTSEGRRRLKNVFISEELGDANAVSLSLYAGPRPGMQHLPRSLYIDDGDGKSKRVGWLLTGDAKLQHHDRRSQWLGFFRPLHDEIGTLMILIMGRRTTSIRQFWQ